MSQIRKKTLWAKEEIEYREVDAEFKSERQELKTIRKPFGRTC